MSDVNADHGSRIAEHAYHIWENEGRPHGRSLDHWLKAEAEVTAVAAPEKKAAPKRAKRTTTTAKAKAPRTSRAKKPANGSA
jgi:hypothetical protein